MNPVQAPYHFPTSLQPLLLQAFKELANATFITDSAGRIVWANAAFCTLSGYTLDELAGRTPALLNSGIEGPVFYAELWQKVLSGRVWRGQVIDKRKDGSLYAANEVITPLRNEDGSVTHFVAVQQDITQQLDFDRSARTQTRMDLFFSRPNRATLIHLLDAAIARSSRGTERTAVIRIAPDGHPDLHGPLIAAGSGLPGALAGRLASTVRQSDTLACVGDAELAILATGISDRDTVLAMVKRLQAALAMPFVVRGERIDLQANIGVALSPEHGGDPGALLCHADHALYQATLQGTNHVQLYQHSFSHGPGAEILAASTMQ
ncbi:diguanylate cyclase [Massilia atriviolacea]|nr:GGDEF domain-containing protein [Massilia atriviolacea]